MTAGRQKRRIYTFVQVEYMQYLLHTDGME